MKPFLAFKNGVKSIQTADYNGTRTVNKLFKLGMNYRAAAIHLLDST